MTYAILADIHANLEALQAVEAALDALPARVDAYLLLGDLVGYNADPAACLRRGLAIADECVRGNHDKAVAGILDDRDFNEVAQAAARRHRAMLTEADLRRLRELPKGPVQVATAPNVVLCHGSPDFEDEYLIDDFDARVSFQALSAAFPDADVCFFGHTHLPAILRQERPARSLKTPVRKLAPDAPVTLEADARYLINPGSVGQPRDGDPRAAFGVFDAGRRRYTPHRVPYPIDVAQGKIRALGLPERLAERLALGR